MSDRWLRSVVRSIQASAGSAESDGLTDAELLASFLAVRDQAAFEQLLRRHGAMVLQTCQRLLRHSHDAEDAFQATFLTLALKASSIGRREAVGSWLFKVAYRVALRVRTLASRGPRATGTLNEVPASAAEEEWIWRDLRPILDAEVNRLPEPYRGAFVLCCLEERSTAEAARQLGCSPGTVASRVARARERLRNRLTRRGITLSSSALAASLAHNVAEAALPVALLRATLAAASATSLVGGSHLISASALALSKGVIRTMFYAKLKVALLVAFGLVVLVGGGVIVARAALLSGSPGDTKVNAPKPAPIADGDKPGKTAENPRYAAWVGQEGQSTRFRREFWISGGLPPGEARLVKQSVVKYALAELTPEKAVIKVSTVGKDDAKTITLPAKCGPEDPGCPKAAGEEEIKVGKTSYKCKIFRYETKAEAEVGQDCQGIPAQVTIWLAPNVPGGVVRRRVELTIKATYVIEESRIDGGE